MLYYNVIYIVLPCILLGPSGGIQFGLIEELSAPLIVSMMTPCIVHLRYCCLVARLNLEAAVLVPSLLSSPFKANAKVVDPDARKVPRSLP